VESSTCFRDKRHGKEIPESTSARDLKRINADAGMLSSSCIGVKNIGQISLGKILTFSECRPTYFKINTGLEVL
jgi:hypothetical protein